MDELTHEEWGEIEALVGGRLESLQDIRWGGQFNHRDTTQLDKDIATLAPIVDKIRRKVRETA